MNLASIAKPLQATLPPPLHDPAAPAMGKLAPKAGRARAAKLQRTVQLLNAPRAAGRQGRLRSAAAAARSARSVSRLPRPALSPAARERLLMEQLPQVRYVARRIRERLPAHVPLEDLVQAGVVGLIDAINRYDPAKNAQLVTYARFRIRGAILDSLRDLDWGPRQLRRRARELEEARAKLQQRLGRTPTETEITAELGISTAEYTRLRTDLHQLEQADINPAAGANAPETTDLDALPGSTPDPFAQRQRAEIQALLAGLLDELPERQRQLLNLYYFEDLTMKEVGAVLGIGESRVCQIHAQLMRMLRQRMQDRMQLDFAAVAM